MVFIVMKGQIITLNKIDYYPSYKQKKLEQAFSLLQPLSRLVLCNLIQYQFKSLLLLFVCSSNHQ